MEADAGSESKDNERASARLFGAIAVADLGNVALSAEHILTQARAAHDRGALIDAERGYHDLLRIDPEHAEAWHLLGVLHFQRGQTKEADALMRRSIASMPSALALTNHASVLTVLGRLNEALACLDRALEINPVHLRALFLRTNTLIELGLHAEAVDACDCLLREAPTLIDGWCRRSAVLVSMGRHAEALASCDRALAIDARSFDALMQRGQVLHGLNRLDDAVESYGHALAVMPGSTGARLKRGTALLGLGRLELALEDFNEALAAQPDLLDALYNSSIVLERFGRYEQALARCDRLLDLSPRHAGALANRGNALHGLDRDREALASYDAALEIEPESREVLCNRTEVLEQLGRQVEALESCERAIAIDDAYGPGWIARGRVLHRLHRYGEALASFDRALTVVPDDTRALYQRGNTLHVMMRHEDALEAYDRVLAIDPKNLSAHFSKAFVFLTLGDFTRGWPEYEWRWREAQVGIHRREFAQPIWLGGESIRNKTILLHAEQGLGDTLQFCRYGHLVKALGARVVLEVQPALKSLLGKIAGIDQLVARGEPLPPFDVHCPLLSLGLVFHTDLTSIPSDVPYLRAEPDAIGKWEKRLGASSRPRIGIVWSGNPQHLNDHNRSIPFAHLLPLFTDDFEWVSLQKVVRESEQVLLEGSAVRHFGDEIMDFSDTAALVQIMDLVISVDTSIAHLAGAMSRRLWLLLPYLSDWRWLLERNDSPWYPGARLFRQLKPGDWDDVFGRVQMELPSMTAARGTVSAR